MIIEKGVLIRAEDRDVINKTVTIPSGVTRIAENSVRGIAGLHFVDIPHGVTMIGESAFAGSRDLESVSVSDSVMDLPHNAFMDCPKLNRFHVDKENPVYSSDEAGVLYNKERTLLVIYPQGKTEASYSMPNSVEHIGDGAFHTVGDASRLSIITLSDNLMQFSAKALKDLPRLSQILVEGNRRYHSDADGVLYSKDMKSLVCYPRGITERRFSIPNGIERIGEYAFCSCGNLERVNIPDGVKIIGDSAFCACLNLTDLSIPYSTTEVGKEAFSDCCKLDRVVIPFGVKAIHGWTFAHCRSLKRISIPTSVTYIGACAFTNCSSLDASGIPESISRIESSAFEGCNFDIKSLGLRNGMQHCPNAGNMVNASKGIVEQKPHDVFISHSSADKWMADSICAALESCGVECWIAPRDVSPNKEYSLCVMEAIRSSKIVVKVASSKAKASNSVQEEVNLANQYGVNIIAIESRIFLPFGISSSYMKRPIISILNPVNMVGVLFMRQVHEIRKGILMYGLPDILFENLESDTSVLTPATDAAAGSAGLSLQTGREPKETMDQNMGTAQIQEAYDAARQEDSKKPMVFISASSLDYSYAGKVYTFLYENNVNAFFASETLKRLGNADYRNQIDNYLDICDHIIVVTSSGANAKSPWVEAEWGFFVNEKRSGRKHGNVLTITFGNVEIKDLPPSLRYYEVMNSNDSWKERILQYLR